MKQLLLSVIMLLVYLTADAQDNYKISGKIDGLPDRVLLLMSDVSGETDTLNTTRVVNGVFEFTGEVEGPVAAYIITEDQTGFIPLIIENMEFTVNVVNGGVLIKGGVQQEIYNRFLAVNTFVLQQQERIEQEILLARQENNNAGIEALANEFNLLLEQAQQQDKQLLIENADTYVAAYMVASGMEQQDPEVLKARYELLGDAAKATVPGRTVTAMLKAMEKLSVGNVAPDFTAVSPSGSAVSLGEGKRKVTLINFWASGSAPCRRDNVELLKLYQRYHAKGFEIISISLDTDRQAWVRAIGEDGMIWNHGLDQKDGQSQVAHLYFVRDIPYSVLLDENNIIVARNLKGDELREKIAGMLKEK